MMQEQISPTKSNESSSPPPRSPSRNHSLTHDLSQMPIDENKEEPASVIVSPLSLKSHHSHHSNDEENDQNTENKTDSNTNNNERVLILWEGPIFDKVQKERHFKDSKTYVDHVLKTCYIDQLIEHFAANVTKKTPQTSPRKLAKNGILAAKFGGLPNTSIHKLISRSKSFQSQKALLQFHNSAPAAHSAYPITFPSTADTSQTSSDDGSDIEPSEFEYKSLIQSRQGTMRRYGSFPRLAGLDQMHSKVSHFLTSNFFAPGFELLGGTPIDWKEHPNTSLFNRILVGNTFDMNRELLLSFAHSLNKLWKILYREVDRNVSRQPHRYSFLPLKHGHIFMPGGRFREIYYWDTFWIIQGLLTCGMVRSSIMLVESLCDLVVRIGFVPNGTRKYYTKRSQPPLLTLMVDLIFIETGDIEWLKSVLPALLLEHKYWTTPPIQVNIAMTQEMEKCEVYRLSRYYSDIRSPRPESHYEDLMTAFTEENLHKKQGIYRNLRATAASGWDFSSRWYYDENGPFGSSKLNNSQFDSQSKHYDLLSDGSHPQLVSSPTGESANNWGNADMQIDESAMSVNEEAFEEFAEKRIQNSLFSDTPNIFSLQRLDTYHVIPVDLNTFLCKVEACLHRFCKIAGMELKAQAFLVRMELRVQDMVDLLWDEDTHQFRDWNVKYKVFGNVSQLSNWMPLWLSDLISEKNMDFVNLIEFDRLVESLKVSNLICSGGIVTTLLETGEQWDFPNCWAPLNSIIIDGLNNMEKHEELARVLATNWISNNYNTFLKTKKMHEKYHCYQVGGGGGGEYVPQTGFGWTNGVCLHLMQMFGNDLKLNVK